MDKLLETLLNQGVLGVAVIGLAYWLVKKDRDGTADRKEGATALQTERTERAGSERQLMTALMVEKDARISDAKEYAASAMKLQEAVFTTVNLGKVADEAIARELSALRKAQEDNTASVRENTGVTADLLATMTGRETEKKP